MKLKNLSIIFLMSVVIYSCNTDTQKENKGSETSAQDIERRNSENSENSNENKPELYEIEESNYCYSSNGKAEFYFTKTETGTISGKLTLLSENTEGVFTGEFKRNILLGTFKYKDKEGKRKAKEMVFLKNDSDHTLKQGVGEMIDQNQKMRFVDIERIKYDGLKFTETDCDQLESYRGY